MADPPSIIFSVIIFVVVVVVLLLLLPLQLLLLLHCVSKYETNVAHYNFDTDQPILIIFRQRCC